jgi:hypothetical protein
MTLQIGWLHGGANWQFVQALAPPMPSGVEHQQLARNVAALQFAQVLAAAPGCGRTYVSPLAGLTRPHVAHKRRG